MPGSQYADTVRFSHIKSASLFLQLMDHGPSWGMGACLSVGPIRSIQSQSVVRTAAK